MVSHKLKTPLVSLLTYSESLLQDSKNLPKGKLNALKIIYQEGKRLAVLVNNILDLSKIESGKMPLVMGAFKPADFVNKSLESVTSLMSQKDQTLSVELDEGLPPVTGDFEKLIQVMFNMLSNAVKFTGKGGHISVGARNAGTVSGGPVQVEFFVCDDGIGIKKSDQMKVFDKFTQIKDIVDPMGGAGLGMPISKQILQLHNSELAVESQPGKGSRFYFKLTAAK
jgi:signal transduction histidine kinase